VSVAAHLIVGPQPEPFLPALLASLEGVADRLLVNDNSGEPDGANARALAASSFARRGALVMDRAPFVDFADARNRVLDLHRAHDAGAWAAFVDADEVHRPLARTVARKLATLPPGIASVDGYTRHYIQSPDWYMSIERRMSFFRVTPDLRWQGAVHEKLMGMSGKALAIPYLYDHYGWVMPFGRLAAKGRQYSGLGQAGKIYQEDEIDAASGESFLAPYYIKGLPLHAPPPPALAVVRGELEREFGPRFAETERAIRALQTPAVRARNVLRRANFEMRWRGRSLDPRALALVAGHRDER
jgi:hypothetical protein